MKVGVLRFDELLCMRPATRLFLKFLQINDDIYCDLTEMVNDYYCHVILLLMFKKAKTCIKHHRNTVMICYTSRSPFLFQFRYTGMLSKIISFEQFHTSVPSSQHVRRPIVRLCLSFSQKVKVRRLG